MNNRAVTIVAAGLVLAAAPLLMPSSTADAETGAGAEFSSAEESTAPSESSAAQGNSASTESHGGTDSADAELEAKLEAARARLEQAAREVAELSARLSRPLVDEFMGFDGLGSRRAIIGVQLDAASGAGGARIQDVSPGGPAAEAGLRSGDVITGIDGKDIKGDQPARQVLRLMRNVGPDTKVNVRVLRDGKSREFTVTARAGVGSFEPPPPPEFHIWSDDRPGFPGFVTPWMGHRPLASMELATLTPQLGRYFGTDKGVLVIRAPKDESLKLMDGDVILAIDGREPSTGSQATRILGSYQSGEKISLRLMRDRKVITVEATLASEEAPPREHSGHRPESVT